MFSAGIVTYNPDIPRLQENIRSISSQVDEVIIFDNGSDNISNIEAACGGTCTIIKNPDNVGIATALNEICRYCESKGCQWVLTLDQDSVCPPNLIEEYKKYADAAYVGIISPRIADRNIGDIEYHSSEECNTIDSCITSASLLNLKVWKEVGGFWEKLFIDMVDFDICWSLQENGYKILRVNTVSLLHELGHSTPASFRGNQVAVLNHSPERYYYIFRNTIAVGRKHHRRKQCFRWNLKRLWLVLRYETNRREKIIAISKGTFDGLRGRLGEKEQ